MNTWEHISPKSHKGKTLIEWMYTPFFPNPDSRFVTKIKRREVSETVFDYDVNGELGCYKYR